MKRFHSLRIIGVIGVVAMLLAACSGSQAGPAGEPQEGSGGAAAPTSASVQAAPAPVYAGPALPTAYVYSGPQPAAGTGIVYGRILWNAQPVVGLEVKLCDEIEWMGGCIGQEYSTMTEENGVYTLVDVPAMSYGLTFRSMDGNDWMFISTLGLNAKDFEVTGGQVLDIGDFNIVKRDMQLVSPAEESRVSEARPTISWQAYPEAASYEVTLSAQKGTHSIFLFEEVTDTSIVVSEDLLTCTYHWYVDAYNAQGIQIAEVDGLWEFNAVEQPFSCEVLGLSPADGASAASDSITLAWDAHGLAAYYQIHMYNADDRNETPLDFVRADSNTYTVTQNVPPGTYEWVVYAYPDTGYDSIAFSDTYTLVVTQ